MTKGPSSWSAAEQGRAGTNVIDWDLVVTGGYVSPAVLGAGARLAGPGDYRIELQSGAANASGVLTVHRPSAPKIRMGAPAYPRIDPR